MWFGAKSFLRLPLHWLCEAGSPSGASFLLHVKGVNSFLLGWLRLLSFFCLFHWFWLKNKNFKKAEVAHSIQRKKSYFADQRDPNRKMKSQRDSKESFLIPQEYRSEKDFLI